MKTIKILAILVLALGLAPMSLAVEDTWTKKADMPTARYLLSTCVVDGKIYAIGGAPGQHANYSVVEVYDPVTDTWTRKADMPTARAGLGTSVVNGKIYAIGGGELDVRIVEEYNPGTDTWTRKADMPTARSFLSTSVVNSKIYAIGGARTTQGPYFSTVEEYDPATDTWTRKADMPVPRYLHATSVVDGKIYIIAGSPRAQTASPAVYEYDPATDTWERKADAPTTRAWLSASAVNGRIYVIGGDFGPPKANVEEYDPATDTWTRRADMPTPRGALSTSALNGKIYVIGGTITLFNDSLSTVEEYDTGLGVPSPDFNGDEIVDIEDLLILIEHWGQDEPSVDIAPPPFGDGIVDVQDLEVLMSYWLFDFRLIAHWKLDETEGEIAYDSVGVYDGALNGVPTWQPTGGAVDGALEFDGIDDYIITPFVLNPADGEFSVFVWIKGGAPGQVILSQIGGANWLWADSLEGNLMTELKATGRGSAALLSQTVITDGDWHRIGLVWDGSHRTLYVDDVAVAEDAQTNLEGSDNGLYIGTGKAMESGTFWTGLIDEVRIYNRAVMP